MGQFGVLEVAIAVAASLVTLVVIKLIEAALAKKK